MSVLNSRRSSQIQGYYTGQGREAAYLWCADPCDAPSPSRFCVGSHPEEPNSYRWPSRLAGRRLIFAAQANRYGPFLRWDTRNLPGGYARMIRIALENQKVHGLFRARDRLVPAAYGSFFMFFSTAGRSLNARSVECATVPVVERRRWAALFQSLVLTPRLAAGQLAVNRRLNGRHHRAVREPGQRRELRFVVRHFRPLHR